MLRSSVAVALVVASADAFAPALMGLKMQSAEKPAVRCRPLTPRFRCQHAVLVEGNRHESAPEAAEGRMALRMGILGAFGAKGGAG